MKRRDMIIGAVAGFPAAALPIAAVMADEPLVQLYEAWRSAEERCLRAYKVLDDAEARGAHPAIIASLERARDRADQGWKEAIAAVVAEPAVGMRGLLVKIRMVAEDARNGSCHLADELIESLAADAERLAGGAA